MNDSRRHNSIPRCIVATNSLSHRPLNYHSQRVSTAALFPLLEEWESSECTNMYICVHTHSWLASRRAWMQYAWALMALTFFPFSREAEAESLRRAIMIEYHRRSTIHDDMCRTHITAHTSKRFCVYACWSALPAVNDLDRI